MCVSTGDPQSEDFIANCTALEKMEDCLGMKLGYLTISVGTNMATNQLDSLISQLPMLNLPRVIVESYSTTLAMEMMMHFNSLMDLLSVNTSSQSSS